MNREAFKLLATLDWEAVLRRLAEREAKRYFSSLPEKCLMTDVLTLASRYPIQPFRSPLLTNCRPCMRRVKHENMPALSFCMYDLLGRHLFGKVLNSLHLPFLHIKYNAPVSQHLKVSDFDLCPLDSIGMFYFHLI